MNKLKLGLIGLGYWGSNYLRILMQLDDVELKYVCDKEFTRFPKSSTFFPTDDLTELVEDTELDAVIIATPASTHYEITKMMLQSGKHVLTEKPLTTSFKQTLELRELSKTLGKTLMVGHIYCFNPAVNYIREMLVNSKLGSLQYGIGLRLGLGPIRTDADCVWDLATHDIAILDYLLGKTPICVSANALSFLQVREGIYDYASIQLKYADNFQFSLIVSWYAAEKIRLWYLVGSTKMLKFDDVNKSTPIAIYDKAVDQNVNFTYKEGDILLPYMPQKEPLLLEVQHFIETVKTGKEPLTNADQAVNVIKVIEAIEKSIRNGGVLVNLE